MPSSRQRHFGVIKILVDAIGNGAVIEQRGKYITHGIQHVLDANDVQMGFLLPGKRSIRQIFCGCGRTHRNSNFFTFLVWCAVTSRPVV